MIEQESGTATEIKIIEAATEIFLQKGKDGARLQEIADKAGINKAMLHYYFRSKDRLYQQVFATQISRFFTSFIDAIPETEDIREFLEYFVENYVRYISANEGLVRFVIWEIQSGARAMPRHIRNLFKSKGYNKPLFLDIIQKAIDGGKIRPLDPVNFVINLLALCAYPFIARPILEKVFTGLKISSEAFIQQRKSEILNMIWEGIKP